MRRRCANLLTSSGRVLAICSAVSDSLIHRDNTDVQELRSDLQRSLGRTIAMMAARNSWTSADRN